VQSDIRSLHEYFGNNSIFVCMSVTFQCVAAPRFHAEPDHEQKLNMHAEDSSTCCSMAKAHVALQCTAGMNPAR